MKKLLERPDEETMRQAQYVVQGEDGSWTVYESGDVIPLVGEQAAVWPEDGAAEGRGDE